MMNKIIILDKAPRVERTEDFDFDAHDRWPVELLGHKPNYSHGLYYLLFNRFGVYWFKNTVKKFIKLQAVSKSLASCRSYITGLAHFDAFLRTLKMLPSAEMVDRELIVRYLSYLNSISLSTVSKKMALIHFRTFHQTIIEEGWLPWPERQLVYTSDMPKSNVNVPKFIPEFVIMQLKQNLHKLPETIQRFIIILLETGRRVTEISSLPFHCLEKDKDGDWFLKVTETKFKRSYLLPISIECYKAITQQQNHVLKNNKFLCKDYVFPASHKASISKIINVRGINRHLNNLAIACHITDDNNQLWHFHSHQFRHTVGTRMINAGVSQVMVQKYLAHESPEMTARYAHIHDQTLKEAFHQYQGKLTDIQGELHALDEDYKNALWLKKNIMSQVLPNGLCALPTQQQRCPHANACLTCGHFRTHKQHLPQHKEQLKQTECFIQQAKEKGFTRQIEMNEKIKFSLETIINRLEEHQND